MINFTEKNALSIIDPSNPLKFSVIMSGIRYKISLVEEIFLVDPQSSPRKI